MLNTAHLDLGPRQCIRSKEGQVVDRLFIDRVRHKVCRDDEGYVKLPCRLERDLDNAPKSLEIMTIQYQYTPRAADTAQWIGGT